MAGGCSLTQRAGPPGGAILRTRFWAQIPAHILNRLPCTQQWGAGQSVPDYGLDSGLKIRSPKSDLPRGGASRFLCPRDPKERRHRRQQCLFNWQLAAEAQSMTSRTLCRQQPANNDGAVYAKTDSRLNAAENLTQTPSMPHVPTSPSTSTGPQTDPPTLLRNVGGTVVGGAIPVTTRNWLAGSLAGWLAGWLGSCSGNLSTREA